MNDLDTKLPWWRPGPVTIAIVVTELIGLWAIAALKWFYDIIIDPVDVRLNMLVVVVIVAWTTERLTH